MIKKKTLLSALAAAGMAFTAISAQAAPTMSSYVNGDLILGFQAGAGQGSGTVVYVNLGLATTFRDSTSNNLTFTNINSVLTNTYGGSWATRSDLYWGAVALASTSGGAVSGDPAQTIYVSATRYAGGTDYSANSDAWVGLGSTARNQIGNQMITMGTSSVKTAVQDGTNTSAGTVSTGGSASWDAYNVLKNTGPLTAGTSFTNLVNQVDFVNGGTPDTSTAGIAGIQQSFGSSQTVPGTTVVVGALDVYRILSTTSGDTFGGTAGDGTYVGSLTLDSSGNVGTVSAVPEPSTYALFGLAAIALIAFRRRLQKA